MESQREDDVAESNEGTTPIPPLYPRDGNVLPPAVVEPSLLLLGGQQQQRPVWEIDPTVRVGLRSCHGTFLRAFPGGRGSKIDLQVPHSTGDWEQFTIEPVDGEFVHIRSVHGTYLRAHPGGDGAKLDLQTKPKHWERFRLLPHQGGYTIQTVHGTFVRAHPSGVGIDLSTRAGEWETFGVGPVAVPQASPMMLMPPDEYVGRPLNPTKPITAPGVQSAMAFAALPSVPHYHKDTWMGDLREFIGQARLCEVRMLGTHDSATTRIVDASAYTMDRLKLEKQKVLKQRTRAITAAWARTQSRSVYEQLCGGVRYIDLRIAPLRPEMVNIPQSQNGSGTANVPPYLWVVHSMYSMPLRDVFADVRRYFALFDRGSDLSEDVELQRRASESDARGSSADCDRRSATSGNCSFCARCEATGGGGGGACPGPSSRCHEVVILDVQHVIYHGFNYAETSPVVQREFLSELRAALSPWLARRPLGVQSKLADFWDPAAGGNIVVLYPEPNVVAATPDLHHRSEGNIISRWYQQNTPQKLLKKVHDDICLHVGVLDGMARSSGFDIRGASQSGDGSLVRALSTESPLLALETIESPDSPLTDPATPSDANELQHPLALQLSTASPSSDSGSPASPSASSPMYPATPAATRGIPVRLGVMQTVLSPQRGDIVRTVISPFHSTCRSMLDFAHAVNSAALRYWAAFNEELVRHGTRRVTAYHANIIILDYYEVGTTEFSLIWPSSGGVPEQPAASLDGSAHPTEDRQPSVAHTAAVPQLLSSHAREVDAATLCIELNLLDWFRPTASEMRNTLFKGMQLHAGESLVSSNRVYRLEHQHDGNVVLYQLGQAVWSTGTAGKSSLYLHMHMDGNLLLLGFGRNDRRKISVLWSSRTTGNGEYAELQDDGNFVVNSASRVPRWSWK